MAAVGKKDFNSADRENGMKGIHQDHLSSPAFNPPGQPVRTWQRSARGAQFARLGATCARFFGMRTGERSPLFQAAGDAFEVRQKFEREFAGSRPDVSPQPCVRAAGERFDVVCLRSFIILGKE